MKEDSLLQSPREAVRGVAKRYFPRALATTRALRYFVSPGRALDHGAGGEVGRKCGWRVASGPFAGMRYPWWLSGSVLIGPKLLGCFESELHATIEGVIRGGYRSIINVGSAEGYYAVGLAMRMPRATVYAYEGDAMLGRLCRAFAELNGVADRVVIRGYCDPDELRQVSLDEAFLLCDVEGYESTLLDADAVPGLRKCDFLVETHDGVNAEITPALLSRFASSHTVRSIKTESRESAINSSALDAMSQDRRALATSEFRKNSRGWLHFESLASSRGTSVQRT